MSVSFPVEGIEGIKIPLLMNVSRIKLVMSLLAKDRLRCVIVG